MSKKRYDRTAEVLTFINDYIEKEGISPCTRDIVEGMGFLSTATAHYYIEKLCEQGLIRRDNNRKRTLRVIKDEDNRVPPIPVPLVGRVSAGIPILAVENIEDVYPLPKNLFKSNNIFLLRVYGDSMIGAGIFNGDLIVVQKETSIENHDIVVALLNENDVTVKRLYYKNGYITLHAENPEYADINVSSDIEIMGKVIGSIRRF